MISLVVPGIDISHRHKNSSTIILRGGGNGLRGSKKDIKILKELLDHKR